MIATCVHIHVKTEFLDEFIKASIENHEHSILEAGNLRFDILQETDDPCLFTFYEVFESEDASAAHKSTAHYQVWRQKVDHMMTEARKGVKHTVIRPILPEKW